MKTFFVLFNLLCFISCIPLMDYDWGPNFANNSDADMYFYLHYYDEGDETYPCYDEIHSKPYMTLIKAHKVGGWSMWPTKFRYGTLGHMYAFDPDTLARYSWEEVLAKKKYWFTARPCRKDDPIQFPEEFEYMGDI